MKLPNVPLFNVTPADGVMVHTDFGTLHVVGSALDTSFPVVVFVKQTAVFVHNIVDGNVKSATGIEET